MTRAGARNLAAVEEFESEEDEPVDEAGLNPDYESSAEEIEEPALVDGDPDESEASEETQGKKRKVRPQFSLPARVVSGVVAAILVVAAYGMPIWITKLKAPQYPAGLELSAYGNRVTGDVFEVDTLNHYIGMRPFRFDDVPEAKLWPIAIILGLVAIVISTIVGRGWLGRLSRLYLWLMPVGVLVNVQYRLYDYGHHLDPAAALRLKPFTPLAVGPTKVWNFTAWSMPGTALISIFVAGVVLSFGPKLVDMVIGKIRKGSETSERAAAEAG